MDRALASPKITSALASTVKQLFCSPKITSALASTVKQLFWWSWSYLAIYLVKYLLGDKVGNIYRQLMFRKREAGNLFFQLLNCSASRFGAS